MNSGYIIHANCYIIVSGSCTADGGAVMDGTGVLSMLVTVVSRTYSTGLGLIRSLGAAGHTVDLIASVRKKGRSLIIRGSKYLRRTVEVWTPEIECSDGSELLAALLNNRKGEQESAFLFPSDDFSSAVVFRNREVLENAGYYVPHTAEDAPYSALELMDKRCQARLAKESRVLKTPKEWVCSLREEIELPKDLTYPCFVKPLQSVNGKKIEMTVCRNREEVTDCLTEMKKRFASREILLQEYLSIDMEYDMTGICIGDSVLIPGVLEKVRIAQHERGVTMVGRMQPVSVLGEAFDDLLRIMKKCQFYGMVDIEVHRVGSQFYFGEINFRSGGPNYSYYLSGVNMPDLLINAIINETGLPESPIIRMGDTFVYEKVAWEDFIYGYLTKSDLNRILREADFTLLDTPEDPKPGRIFRRRIRMSAVKHMLAGSRTRRKPRCGRERSASGRRKVVLVGRNYGNLLMTARDFGEAGYGVEILRLYPKRPGLLHPLQAMHPEKESRYVRRYEEAVIGRDEEAFRLAVVRFREKERKLLVPVDDYAAYFVDRSLELLREHFETPNIRGVPGEICRMMNKSVQKELAKEYGIPVRKGITITTQGGRAAIPERLPYPLFIKPLLTVDGNKKDLGRVESEEDLKRYLADHASRGKYRILAEEWADIEEEYALLGVSSPESAMTSTAIRILEQGHRVRSGVSIRGQVIPLDEFREIDGKIRRMLTDIGYTGLYDADLMKTKEGEFFLIELNFRGGVATRVSTLCGVNLPAMLAGWLCDRRPLNAEDAVCQTGYVFVNEKMLLEEYLSGDITMKTLQRMMEGSDIRLFHDAKDPAPDREFGKVFRSARRLRVFYRVRNGVRGVRRR